MTSEESPPRVDRGELRAKFVLGLAALVLVVAQFLTIEKFDGPIPFWKVWLEAGSLFQRMPGSLTNEDLMAIGWMLTIAAYYIMVLAAPWAVGRLRRAGVILWISRVMAVTIGGFMIWGFMFALAFAGKKGPGLALWALAAVPVIEVVGLFMVRRRKILWQA